MNRFIVFEGCDGTGKSSTIKLLNQYLIDEGNNSIILSFPNYTSPIGNVISRYSDKTDHQMMAGLYALNRREYISTIRNYLENGYYVLCDRWIFSGIVYGLAKGVDKEYLFAYEKGIILPTIIFYLECDLDIAQSRIAQRYKQTSNIHDKPSEVLENKEFQSQVKNIYYDIIHEILSDKSDNFRLFRINTEENRISIMNSIVKMLFNN